MEGYFLPPLSFTAEEAALLVLGGEFVRERVDAEPRRAAEDALGKLAAVLPPERREVVARWRRELLFPHIGGDADEPRLARLRAAIQERRVLRLLYHAFRRADRGLDRFAEARVRFDPTAERWVRERQPFFFHREEADPAGAVFVYAVRDERELLGWLLSWGAHAEVLSPPDLRARLTAEARAILARHADPAESPAVARSPATTVSAGPR